MSDQSVKRQLGGMPTGEYRMADMQFSVREIKPPKPQEEPSTIPEYELWNIDPGVVICAKDPQPFQELEEAVERMIRIGMLK
jgi:hypothetical protein